jgi:hypothetical protein
MGMEEFPDHGTVVLCMLRTTEWGVSQATCHKIYDRIDTWISPCYAVSMADELEKGT